MWCPLYIAYLGAILVLIQVTWSTDQALFLSDEKSCDPDDWSPDLGMIKLQEIQFPAEESVWL